MADFKRALQMVGNSIAINLKSAAKNIKDGVNLIEYASLKSTLKVKQLFGCLCCKEDEYAFKIMSEIVQSENQDDGPEDKLARFEELLKEVEIIKVMTLFAIFDDSDFQDFKELKIKLVKLLFVYLPELISIYEHLDENDPRIEYGAAMLMKVTNYYLDLFN